ncbi:MAG: tripartite tricarboxylate transporter substrate binding protein [Rhodovarius sp.]|nr:tripartite tricarboxylate transporter substrate binding protein [Rhodovarius sp.]MCX7933297.1 tripartite tricarboxylate transporter substrate binding protein [Rhodovarius sp.]MDW8313533.1 tripartite tricarboxylate transporter substrate binding protein [Rhodovarius sp.]
MRRRALLAALPLLVSPALAQSSWQPDRPIRIVVPFPPGGATDIWARLVAEPMSEMLRVPVVVENRSGASGMLGAEFVAKAAPDGHTLLFTITPLVQSPIVLNQHPYDAVRDFLPIGQMGTTTLMFLCRAALPPRTLAEFIAFARERARAGRGLNLGSWAAGSTAHVFGLQLNNSLGLGMTHVLYRGEAPMLTAYLAGEVDCGLNSLTTTREHIAAGRLRPLAALGDRRAGGMPEVPTFIEQGVDIGRGWSGFIGLLGPARMPPHVHARLVHVFRETMQRESILARLRQMDTDPLWLGPEDFAATIRRVRDIWTELTRGMDLQLG